MSEDLPILPPALESLESQSPQPQHPSIHTHSHKNAITNVMKELADSKEHIDRTVLPSSHNFNGRPCLNMKEFFKLMTENNKKQQNLDALYSLVENDSDSIIGFVELNGLSFIDEWLDTARKENDYWLSLCILQFLAHDNLHITYQSLQTAPIAKAVKQFINPHTHTHTHKVIKILSPQSLPRLTDKIRVLLPQNLNITRANDNFTTVIDRTVIHKIVHEDKDLATISYLQSQFASRIVNKWKKFVGDWKKHNNRPLYRCVRFADEKVKPLVTSTVFHLNDAPMLITQQRDKKRREKMLTTVKWCHPHRMQIESLLESESKRNIERGRDSKEKKIQKERVMGELEEFPIGTENLKDPKSLCNSPIISAQKPTVIPLESEQTSPSVELTNGQNIRTMPPGPGMPAPPYMTPQQAHLMATRGVHGPGPYPTMPPPQAHMIARGPYPHPIATYPHGYPHPHPPPYPPHHPGYPPPYPPPPHMRPPPPRVSHVPPPYPNPYQPPPPQGPGPGMMAVQVNSDGILNGNVNKNNHNHRRRDFNAHVNRPAKRQKIHDNRDNNNNNNNNRERHYDRMDRMDRRDHRNRHHKHKNKKHKNRNRNRRGRGRGRRNNKNDL